jgi:hypothetical protein
MRKRALREQLAAARGHIAGRVGIGYRQQQDKFLAARARAQVACARGAFVHRQRDVTQAPL